MLEPQEGLTYAAILAVARRAEALGFEGLYRSDHYGTVGGGEEPGSTDAWATLAGLARETNAIALGTLVTPVTFRRLGNLAKVVATVDEMAGPGRVHLGLGTGWLEAEHCAFGFPFPGLDERYRMLEQHLEALPALLAGDGPLDYHGEHERLEGLRLVPAPDPPPRVIVGGKGPRRTPALAAAHADELNVVFPTPDEAAQRRRALEAACERIGRDRGEVTLSVMTGCLVGETEREARRLAERLKAASGDPRPFDEWRAELAEAWVLGTPEQAADRLGKLAEQGVERVMLQHQLPDELDMLDVVAEEVVPRLGGAPAAP